MSNALALAVRVVVVAVALGVATWWLDGITVTATTTPGQIGTLLLVAVIFGLVNAVLKPLIKVVGCPLYVLTLGLVGLVVNALLFLLVGMIASGIGIPFVVGGFWDGFWGAIIVSIVAFVLHLIIPDRIDQR